MSEDNLKLIFLPLPPRAVITAYTIMLDLCWRLKPRVSSTLGNYTIPWVAFPAPRMDCKLLWNQCILEHKTGKPKREKWFYSHSLLQAGLLVKGSWVRTGQKVFHYLPGLPHASQERRNAQHGTTKPLCFPNYLSVHSLTFLGTVWAPPATPTFRTLSYSIATALRPSPSLLPPDCWVHLSHPFSFVLRAHHPHQSQHMIISALFWKHFNMERPSAREKQFQNQWGSSVMHLPWTLLELEWNH